MSGDQIKDLYVAYIDSAILFSGTKAECTAYREAQPYATDCWRISDIETYGETCYSDGYDSGYDAGADNE